MRSRRACALPAQAGRAEDTCALVVVDVEGGQDGGPRTSLATSATYGTPARSAASRAASSSRPCEATIRAASSARGSAAGPVGEFHVAGRGRHPGRPRPGPRGWRRPPRPAAPGMLRLQEDLDRAAAEAGIRDLDGALLAGCGTARRARRAAAAARAGTRVLQAVFAHGGLDAVAAHEPVDFPVGQHQGGVAGVGAGGVLRPHHRGAHERFPASGEFLRPRRQGFSRAPACQTGGLGRPCMASQTRAGVQGMSMCITP